MAAHVFVCYAREDLDFVLKLASALKSQGVPLWLDQWDIPHGANWNRTRDNALYDAAQCIVVLSPAAVDSEQVEAEWVTALEEKKHLVPILYQTCRVPSRLRLLQHFDFTKSGVEDEAALSTLVRVLGGQQQAISDSSTFKQETDSTLAVRSEGCLATNPRLTSLPSVFRNNIGMDFVLIPAGGFHMGSENGRRGEKPVHLVRISQSFYLGRYPVTQAQWQAVMRENPSHFVGDPNRPVEKISWYEAQAFLQQLGDQELQLYRLPTEAEWEYAARAGATTAYCFGDDPGRLSDYGWYDRNSGKTTHPVGRLKPNAWGLHDIHGNVWEWVQDWYDEAYYQRSPMDDPKGPEKTNSKIIRGGGWHNLPGSLRVSARSENDPSNRFDGVGFRIVMLLKLPPTHAVG